MSFDSTVFLFIFLPVCLLVYFAADRRYRNGVALLASLVFFAWGQLYYLPLMLALIAANYAAGRRIEAVRAQPGPARRLLAGIIVLNLLPLVFYKLISGYGTAWLGLFLMPEGIDALQQHGLPLGLSYIVFQLISYQVDVYNELADSEKRFLTFALYVLLFPKIIVGPIARYRDLAAQFEERQLTPAGVAEGVRRFILGLAKKALIADTLGRIVNPAFDLPAPNFSTGIAWLVMAGYALQLYFDFSGYTDMAIGLGQMLGFRFVENFNYPYISKSISEFWRRWHISLSSWFRDYVFYPLEFTRRRADRLRQQLHVLIVFLLTGLWHGLTLTFVAWGLLHGLAIALEMGGLGRALKRAWAPLQHAYALAVILVGWVFFRSASLSYAGQFLARLAGWQGGITPLPYTMTQPLPVIDPSVWLALAAGILFSLPVFPAVQKSWQQFAARRRVFAGVGVAGADLVLLLLLAASVAALVSARYVTNIYGGF